MVNPIIAEVTRGPFVESVHRGAYAIVDGDGALVDSAGNIDHPIFARSALKLMQALPLIESGAAEAMGFTAQHLALACASHSGAPEHVAGVREMLAAADVGPEDLQCGAHVPIFRTQDTISHAQSGVQIDRTSNQCSGKHAGFLATTRHLGLETATHLAPDHPVQVEVKAAISSLSDHDFHPEHCACDGCSAPTYALPLRGFAQAFARLTTGTNISATRFNAAQTLFAACLEEPLYMSGEGRFDAGLIVASEGQLFAKTGAEGVYIAAIPSEGLAFAVKTDDGNARASEVTTAALASRYLPDLTHLASRAITDWNGQEVGQLRAC
ncbi:MAG: asparaginase [Pseudomonadota bacterium]